MKTGAEKKPSFSRVRAHPREEAQADREAGNGRGELSCWGSLKPLEGASILPELQKTSFPPRAWG